MANKDSVALENYLISYNEQQSISNNLLKDVKSISDMGFKQMNSILGNINNLMVNQQKGSFTLERKQEIDQKIQEDRNDLLSKQNDLIEKGNEIKIEGSSDQSGLSGLLAGGLGGLLGKTLLKGLSGSEGILDAIFAPALKLLSSLGFGELKGLGFKGGLKAIGKGVLKKVLLPLQVILSIFDFIHGFQNAKEITGSDSLIKKIQAGVSSVVSGLTFGIIDPKTISKGIDFIVDGILSLFNNSVQFLKDIIKKYDIVGKLNARVETVSFGLFNFEDLTAAIGNVFSKLTSIFLTPFKMVKDIFEGNFDINKTVDDYISNVTFGLFNLEDLKTAYEKVKDKLFNFFKEPFNYLKGLVSEGLDFASDLNPFKEKPAIETPNQASNQTENPVLSANHTFTGTGKIKPVLSANHTFPEIKKEIKAKENKQNQVKPEPRANQNLVNTTNNNIIQDYDLSTETTDIFYRTQLAY